MTEISLTTFYGKVLDDPHKSVEGQRSFMMAIEQDSNVVHKVKAKLEGNRRVFPIRYELESVSECSHEN